MTIINGEISNQLGAKLDGTVWIAAAYHRPVDNVLVLADWAATPLVDSAFTAEAIPGPARLRVEAGSVFAEWDIVIPDEGPVEVTALMQDSIDYPEPVVLAAQAAANRATKEANRAEAAAAIVGSAQRVLEAEAASAASAGAAAQSASESASSASASASSATTAGEHEDAARGVLTETVTARNDAQASATASATSAGESAGSATAAASSATTADAKATSANSSANRAWSGSEAAVVARNAAQTAQTAAEVARDTAQEHASSAADSCSQAQDAAINAADDVRGELQGLRTEAQTAATAAATSAGESADSAEQARLSAESAAEAVASGVADATTSIKGKLRLAGDLAGTAEAPTVPGLEQRAPLTHTHTIGQVDGLQATVDEVDKATYQATAGRIMRRGTDGTVSVAPPTGSTHVATKGYVDGRSVTSLQVSDATSTTGRPESASKLVKTWTDGYVHVNGAPSASTHATPKSYVDARPAMWLWSGDGEWEAPAAANSGDSVLNLADGTIYSITEV